MPSVGTEQKRRHPDFSEEQKLAKKREQDRVRQQRCREKQKAARQAPPAPLAAPPAAATSSQEQVDPNQAQQQTPADAARLVPCKRCSSAGSRERRGMMAAKTSAALANRVQLTGRRFVWVPSSTVEHPQQPAGAAASSTLARKGR